MADGLADRRLLVTSPGVRSCIRASGAAPDLCGRGSHALMENRNRRKSSWPRSGRTSVDEWAVPGSNQRPPACKAGALPTELTARRPQDKRGSDAQREAGLAGLAELVEPGEGVHGGNRVSPVSKLACQIARMAKLER